MSAAIQASLAAYSHRLTQRYLSRSAEPVDIDLIHRVYAAGYSRARIESQLDTVANPSVAWFRSSLHGLARIPTGTQSDLVGWERGLDPVAANGLAAARAQLRAASKP